MQQLKLLKHQHRQLASESRQEQQSSTPPPPSTSCPSEQAANRNNNNSNNSSNNNNKHTTAFSGASEHHQLRLGSDDLLEFERPNQRRQQSDGAGSERFHSSAGEDQSLLASSGYRSQTSAAALIEFDRRRASNGDARKPTCRAGRTASESSPSESCSLIDEASFNLRGAGSDDKKRRKKSPAASVMSASSRLVLSYFVAELLGTFILVFIGDGAIAAYVLTRHPVEVFNVCLAFGVGAMMATYAAAKISGAHLNPAATLAVALDGKLSWRLVPVYLLAQYLGGFLAALLLYANYAEAISALDGGARSAFGAANSTGSIFATYPAEWVSVWGALLDQIVGTAMLLFALSAVTDEQNSGPEPRHQPLLVALVIGLTCFAFSPNCGAIFNPARDLAPRLLTWLVGYSADVWAPVDGLYWLLAGLVGPHLGAILGYFGYKLLIGASLQSKRQYELEHEHEQRPQAPSLRSIGGGGGGGGGRHLHSPFDHQHQKQPAAKLAGQVSQSTPDGSYGSAMRQ